MSTFNNVFPVCVQLSLGQNLANIETPRNGNFTWSAPFTYSTSPIFIQNDLTSSYQYDVTDIKVGHWIATNGGLAWRVYNKQLNQDGSVKFFLEDVDNYCINLDNTGNQGLPSTGGYFISFEVNEDGQPLIFTIDIFSDSLRQLPVNMITRFSFFNTARQHITVYQVNHGLHVGDPIWIDPSDGKYKKSNTANAKYIIGIVTDISSDKDTNDNTITVNNFNFKAYGTYYTDLASYFSGLDFSSYVKGDFLYLSTDGIHNFTTTAPSSVAVPTWVYL
jgi:hypothetical protein